MTGNVLYIYIPTIYSDDWGCFIYIPTIYGDDSGMLCAIVTHTVSGDVTVMYLVNGDHIHFEIFHPEVYQFLGDFRLVMSDDFWCVEDTH